MTTTQDTSLVAYKLAKKGARQTAYRIYLQVKDAGQHGMTRDELVQCFQVLGVDYSTVTARCRALVFSKLFTEGPDTRPTRKGNAALLLRSIPGLDFKTMYREPPPKAGKRCSAAEREFLDRCHSLAMTMRASSLGELDKLDAPKVLWGCFRELRQAGEGVVQTASGFRDSLGNCAWCHDAKCGNGCVT